MVARPGLNAAPSLRTQFDHLVILGPTTLHVSLTNVGAGEVCAVGTHKVSTCACVNVNSAPASSRPQMVQMRLVAVDPVV